jgi:molecular chaperone DnaK
METRTRDLSGDEIYLDIPLQRDTFDALISDRVADTITAAHETLSQAGLTSNDVEEIVWVGGPTNYKPLQDKVAFGLGIPGDRMTVNPMTAVAEGASVFAESVDWRSETRSRKESRGQISSGGALSLIFNYIARTPRPTGKIAVQMEGQATLSSEFQIDSIDTGWSSGRLPLKHGSTVNITLTKPGENVFKVSVYDALGGPIAIEQSEIIITKTAATIDAIPASHAIALEILEKSGGPSKLMYLIRKGEPLPKQGTLPKLKAGESVVAGSPTDVLNFKLWSGEIEEPITDNQPVGLLKITGTKFDEGHIPTGADLECSYEILDSGELKLEVSVACIGATFNDAYYYGDMEVPDARRIAEEGEKARDRIENINEVIEDPKLEQAKQKLTAALTLDPEESDLEKRQEQNQAILEAKELLYQVRKENLKEIRQIELDEVHTFFDMYVRQHARSTEVEAFDNLIETARRAIDNNENDLEDHLDELRGRNFEILWRQDWFVIQRFKYMADSPHLFADKDRFEELAHIGNGLMNHQDMQRIISGMRDPNESIIKSEVVDQLRGVVAQMTRIPRMGTASDYDEIRDAVTNILVE